MLRRRPRPPATTRTTGPPTSSNGASSMHVWWDAGRDARTISATLEVVEAPSVDRLHFWALQATFVDRHDRAVGTAHLGLQWYAAHPGSTAVNWGGYRPHGRGELEGATESTLPSATGNANTRDFAWRPHTPYRLTIDVDGRGLVTDLGTGRTTVVRRLAVDGAAALTDAVAWSEVFARCDDPPSAVRWSALSPEPTTLHVTYQSYENGGCTNTNVDVDHGHGAVAVTQRTNCERTTPEGRLA